MRSFDTGLDPELLKGIQRGILFRSQYKGVPCLKSPFDLSIYHHLFWVTKPKTIIEIGSKHGGSALFFSDLSKNYSLDAKIISIDINPPPEIEIPSVEFVTGDASDLSKIFGLSSMKNLPRPWIIIEDSAHTYEVCTHVLDYFGKNLEAGEYLVMEDGNLDELGLSEKYNGGPNRAISDFFDRNPMVFEVDEFYCDFFGYNKTYNPNGYLKKR